MAILGYARVSSVGQSLDVQIDKLSEYGCSKIYREKRSGTTDDREELKKILDYVRSGDTIAITNLDRLARSTLHLTQIVDSLEKKGVDFVVIDQNIDTSTSTGKLLFHVLASISEFEISIRKDRVMSGIAKAKENGVIFGAKPKLTDDQIKEMSKKRSSGVLIRELMTEYGLSKSSVYRLIQTV